MTIVLPVAAAVCLSESGCALIIPPECRYLKTAQGHATAEAVQKQLGAPVAHAVLPTGEAVWRYEVREEQPFHRGTPTGFWCDEYQLTFDRQSVLREWTHRSYFHGGSLNPEPCRVEYERLAL